MDLSSFQQDLQDVCKEKQRASFLNYAQYHILFEGVCICWLQSVMYVKQDTLKDQHPSQQDVLK